MATWARKASSWHRTWGERNSNFFLHFWRRSTSTGRISSRHRFAQPRDQCKSFRKKIRPSNPHLHGALRATWQTNRKTIKRAWNLQDTTYPFGDNLFKFSFHSFFWDLKRRFTEGKFSGRGWVDWGVCREEGELGGGGGGELGGGIFLVFNSVPLHGWPKCFLD